MSVIERITPVALVFAAACAGPASSVESSPAEPGPSKRGDELAEHFAAEGVDGAIVVADSAREGPLIHHLDRIERRYIPASTFKIPNSLIALETGVAPGADFPLPWDGEKRWVEAWNRDHDMRSAFRVSAVWYYQEIARRIGPERMQKWLDRLGYGNRDIGGGIDRFWLDGAVRISPLEQIEFLKKLKAGTLPMSARSQDIVRDIMVLEKTPEYTLRAKTGWAFPDQPEEVGWFVGWVERGDRTVYFATVVLAPPKGKMLKSRRAVTERVLRALGAM